MTVVLTCRYRSRKNETIEYWVPEGHIERFTDLVKRYTTEILHDEVTFLNQSTLDTSNCNNLYYYYFRFALNPNNTQLMDLTIGIGRSDAEYQVRHDEEDRVVEIGIHPLLQDINYTMDTLVSIYNILDLNLDNDTVAECVRHIVTNWNTEFSFKQREEVQYDTGTNYSIFRG